LTWLAYALLAAPLAGQIARRWGPRLVQAGDGKFADASVFLQHRFWEAAWLLSVTLAVGLGAMAVGRVFARRLPALWRWVAYSAAGFIGLNLWVTLACRTCLFWCLFWNGKGTTANLTQFYVKLLVMDENPAPIKVALGGSSQVRTQIDHRLLNRQCGARFFSAELGFPGNRANDFLFLDRKLQGHKADIVVCYLSELSFFCGLSDGLSFFMTFGDLPEFHRLGGQIGWSRTYIGHALLGNALPLFYLRDVAAQRALGNAMLDLSTPASHADPEADQNQQAKKFAAGFALGPKSDFQTRAFEAFVAKCAAQHRTVVLCCGQLNPVLARELNPELRPHMQGFLRHLAAKYDNVVLLEEKEFPAQTAADYEDFTHVGPAARERFTTALAHILQNLDQFKRQNHGRQS
jgi:hypothetical protein